MADPELEEAVGLMGMNWEDVDELFQKALVTNLEDLYAPRVNPFWALSCSPAQDSSRDKVRRGRVVTCESHEFGPAQSSRGSSLLLVD